MIETEAVIIGAGPVGLFAIFQLGLIDVNVHVIDVLPNLGGQCGALYPEKPIYDIPALPVITGQELVCNLLQQSSPFGAVFHMGELAIKMEQWSDGRFVIETDCKTRIIAKVVVIAAGGGRFQPKRPPIPGIQAFENVYVFYAVKRIEDFRDKNVLIVGGGDSALDWVLGLASVAASITLIHRRDEFRAAPDSVRKMRDLVANDRIALHIGQVMELSEVDGRLRAAVRQTDETVYITCDRMLPFFGLTMKPGPVAEWQLKLDNNLIVVDTCKFETSHSGVYAIGDINTYPGKRKLILSGFHEAALMAQSVYQRLHPEQAMPNEYTTSSVRLQKKLGRA